MEIHIVLVCNVVAGDDPRISIAAFIGVLEHCPACGSAPRLPIEPSNPIVGDRKRFIDPMPQLRQFYCPGCALLIESEIAVADDPVLRDVELEVR